MGREVSELPLKLYYRIGEVAEIVGVEPHVLRYWESEFRSIKPQKSRSGQRVYSRRDVEKLVRVRELLYLQGFTIAGARRKLQQMGAEPDPAGAEQAAVVSEIRDSLLELREQITVAMQKLAPAECESSDESQPEFDTSDADRTWTS